MSEIRISIKNLYKVFGAAPDSMVELVQNGVSKADLLKDHGHVLGLNNINIDIPARGIQVIMGLSGSGKSTLIRHINRLIEPTAGEVIVDGRDVLGFNEVELRQFRRFTTSMVFQKFALMPHHTIAENVAYGLEIQGVGADEVKRRSGKWIERVGLAGFEDHYPAQLSGGMQQRVGLARALATDAEILLMDEAFSALDPLIRTDMQEMLLDLQQELHKTIVFITHDLDEALHIGDQIAILRDGLIVQKGTTPEIILSPADDYVADFTKDINRARVLKVGAIMEAGTLTEGPMIDKSSVIEEALQVISGAGASSAVVTENAKPVGSVSLETMILAIARREAQNKGSEAYL
ncbi:MAG TPA: glycine betaine/L-proline ABC transporter ATP-binding protein [Rhizobiales bacterium]|nr:glycine betaine/L-proline ABC transporter ATP-binding protein [Hyphomicrobiales bacterium]